MGDLSLSINLASMSGDGDWPIAGGLLDQSAWFVNLYQQLKSDEARIDSDKWERQRGKRRH